MNSVHLVGVLSRKFAKRTVQVKNEPTSILSFTVKTKDGKQEDFVSCEAWGGLADRLDAMELGTPVFVFGKLRSSSYEKNGQTIYKQDVNVKNAAALSVASVETSKPVQQAVKPEPVAVASVEIDDEIPF